MRSFLVLDVEPASFAKTVSRRKRVRALLSASPVSLASLTSFRSPSRVLLPSRSSPEEEPESLSSYLSCPPKGSKASIGSSPGLTALSVAGAFVFYVAPGFLGPMSKSKDVLLSSEPSFSNRSSGLSPASESSDKDLLVYVCTRFPSAFVP